MNHFKHIIILASAGLEKLFVMYLKPQNNMNTVGVSDTYLVFAHILASGHGELSSIDISIQSDTLERTLIITH